MSDLIPQREIETGLRNSQEQGVAEERRLEHLLSGFKTTPQTVRKWKASINNKPLTLPVNSVLPTPKHNRAADRAEIDTSKIETGLRNSKEQGQAELHRMERLLPHFKTTPQKLSVQQVQPESLGPTQRPERNAFEQDVWEKVEAISEKLKGFSGEGAESLWKEQYFDDYPIDLTEWKEAAAQILDVQLDKVFMDGYDKVCADTAKELANDETVKSACVNWSDWTAQPDKFQHEIQTFMERVIEIQSNLIGLRDNTPVKVEWEEDKNSSGGFDRKSGDIGFNPNSHLFGDFREILDTLTHENTHAYQAQLAQDYEDSESGTRNSGNPGYLQPGDPNYAAAMAFSFNNEFYIDPKASKILNDSDATYKAQCTEVHAWRAGEKTGQEAYRMIMNGLDPSTQSKVRSRFKALYENELKRIEEIRPKAKSMQLRFMELKEKEKLTREEHAEMEELKIYEDLDWMDVSEKKYRDRLNKT